MTLSAFLGLRQLGRSGMLRDRRLSSVGAVALYVYLALVFAVSAMRSAQLVSLGLFAASPAKVASGHLWVLVTSAVVVDRPVLVSLLAFAALAIASLAVCGGRILWAAAVVGHVLSTLIVYAAIGLVRLGQPLVFSGVLRSADYGVSAVSAAWLGAIAAVLWRAHGNRGPGRVAIAASCLAVGVFAYSVHPDHGALASEHVFAFAVGVLAASPRLRRKLGAAAWEFGRRRWLLRRIDPFLAAPIVATLVIMPFVVAPTAVATLVWFVENKPPTVARCLTSWNWNWLAPRSSITHARSTYAVVRVRRSPVGSRGRPSCTIVFYGPGRTVLVSGAWAHGLVAAWQARPPAVIPAQPANATVSRIGRLHRRPVRRHR